MIWSRRTRMTTWPSTTISPIEKTRRPLRTTGLSIDAGYVLAAQRFYRGIMPQL
jgi:hypothetical protein